MLHEIDYYISNDYMKQMYELIYDDNLMDKMTNNNGIILFDMMMMMMEKKFVHKLGILNI